jgi:hypothetical protein
MSHEPLHTASIGTRHIKHVNHAIYGDYGYGWRRDVLSKSPSASIQRRRACATRLSDRTNLNSMSVISAVITKTCTVYASDSFITQRLQNGDYEVKEQKRSKIVR